MRSKTFYHDWLVPDGQKLIRYEAFVTFSEDFKICEVEILRDDIPDKIIYSLAKVN